MKKTKHKSRITLILKTAFLVVAGFSVPAHFSHAFGLKDFINWVLILIAYILKFVLYLITWVMKLVGEIFNYVYKGGLDIFELDVINTGWALTRDVLNMFFVIALLAIAFATILRIESYQYKILLPKLIYAALLVNFSRTIAQIFIDFSNSLMTTLLNLSGGTISQYFAYALFKTEPTTISDAIDPDKAAGYEMAFKLCLAIIIVIFILGLLSFAIFALSLMIIVRNSILMILVILSPAAFVLNILPATQQYAKKWWDEFLKYVFYGPVAAFCVYLSIMLARNVSALTDKAKGWILADPSKVSTAGMLDSGKFYSILVMIVFMFMSVMMVRALSPMAAGIATGVAKRGVGLAGKAVGWAASRTGGLIGRRLERSLAKGWGGAAGKPVGVLAAAATGLATLPARLFGRRGNRFANRATAGALDAGRFLSPRVTREAWRQRQDRLDRLAFGTGIGWARDTMNTVFRDKDRTNYERAAKQANVNEEMESIKKTFPNLRHDALRQELGDAVRRKNLDRAEALMRLLYSTADANEIFRDMAQDEVLYNKMHSAKFRRGEHYDPETGEKITDEETLKTLEENKHAYTYYNQQDMMRHVFGDERAAQVMMDVGQKARQNGDMSLTESVSFDVKEGKFKFNSIETQAAGFATDYGKFEADKKCTQSRWTPAIERYDAKGSGQIKSLQAGFKQWLREFGPDLEDIGRAQRKMPRVTKQAMADAVDDFKDIIRELRGKGETGRADRIVEYYNTIATDVGRPQLPTTVSEGARSGAGEERPPYGGLV